MGREREGERVKGDEEKERKEGMRDGERKRQT